MCFYQGDKRKIDTNEKWKKLTEYILHKHSPAFLAAKTVMPLMTRDTLKLFASLFLLHYAIWTYILGELKNIQKRHWKEKIRLMEDVKKRVI